LYEIAELYPALEMMWLDELCHRIQIWAQQYHCILEISNTCP